MQNENALTLEWTPAGKQTATVTARLNGDPLAVEKLDLTKGKARAAFANTVCDGQPGIDRRMVEGELLKLAAEMTSRGNGKGEQPTEVGTVPEIDVSRIVRPEQFIVPDPAGWQSLRDDLHASAMEYGPTWLKSARQTDVCPAMSGRDFELWQPLLALASWIESHGAQGLLKLMQEHALAVIDLGRDDQTPEYDETLLKVLADLLRVGERPTPTEILDKAKEVEPEGFKRWTAGVVAQHLKRYGLTTNKSHGRKVYNQVGLDDLRNIETSYGLDLGLSEEE